MNISTHPTKFCKLQTKKVGRGSGWSSRIVHGYSTTIGGTPPILELSGPLALDTRQMASGRTNCLVSPSSTGSPSLLESSGVCSARVAPQDHCDSPYYIKVVSRFPVLNIRKERISLLVSRVYEPLLGSGCRPDRDRDACASSSADPSPCPGEAQQDDVIRSDPAQTAIEFRGRADENGENATRRDVLDHSLGVTLEVELDEGVRLAPDLINGEDGGEGVESHLCANKVLHHAHPVEIQRRVHVRVVMGTLVYRLDEP